MEEVMSHLQALDGSDVEMTLEVMVNFPSFLLIGGLLPFWSDLGRLAPMRRALLGINASVVGILLAALFQPVRQTEIGGAEFNLVWLACGAFLRRGGCFHPGLIHSSAESLH